MSSHSVVGLYQPYPHTLGGVQSVVTQLARALPGAGFEPLVICPEEGRYTQSLREQGLPFLVSDPGPAWHVYGRGSRGLTYLFSPARAIGLVRYWWRLARELRQRRVALLHCNDYRGVMLAAPAARLARIPVLWHMHGFLPSRAANILAARLAQWTVPVSSGMLDYLDIPRWVLGDYHVIHNGVEDRTVFTAANAADPPVVLAVGTLHPRKGYETLIDAFPLVLEHCPEAECWIAGSDFADGSHTRGLQERIGELGLAKKVRLLGARSDVPELMGRCRLLCVPSRIEPFGLVALEAMLAARPVVACRTGGLPEIVLDGETGRVVDPEDPSALAQAIVGTLADRDVADRFGRAGQERAREKFSLQRMIEEFACFYSRLLGSPSPSRASQARALERGGRRRLRSEVP